MSLRLKIAIATLSVLGTNAFITAQTRWESVPRGYENKGGNYYSTLFGSLADGLMQFQNAGFRDNRPKVIDRMYFRRDPGHYYRSHEAAGRSWRYMGVHMGETYGYRDSNGWLKPPRGVAMSWVHTRGWSMPTKVGRDLNPAWSELAVPFSRPWIYSGRFDLLTEIHFRGGTLTNGRSWGPSHYRGYRLDGLVPQRYSENSASVTYHTSRCYTIAGRRVCFWTCLDSSYLPWNSNRTYLQDLLAGATVTAGSVSRDSLLKVNLNAHYVGANRPAMFVMGSTGAQRPWDIGSRCNKALLNLNMLLDFFPAVANSAGTASLGRSWSFQDAWAYKDLWFQAAYSDTKTGQLVLTSAAQVRLPPRPRDVASPPYRAAVYGSLDSKGFMGPRTFSVSNHTHHPLPMFRFK